MDVHALELLVLGLGGANLYPRSETDDPVSDVSEGRLPQDESFLADVFTNCRLCCRMDKRKPGNDMYRVKTSGVATHNIGMEDTDFEAPYAEVVEMFKMVLRMRYLDEGAEKLYVEGRIRGFCHLDIGHEGVYAGLRYVSRGDKFICSYRCHAMAIAAGISVREVAGELLGKRDGVSKGKGGSMHLYNESLYGGHGIVGAQVPLGCGVAYALKYLEGPRDIRERTAKNVLFCLYGDGASNQGQVYESFNMAKLWNLPVVFIVLNNMYGMWTPVADACADDCFYRRSNFLPGLRVSTRDLFSTIKCLELSRKHALEEGPIVLQIDTYRFCGHSTADRISHRSAQEVQEERKMDVAAALGDILAEKFGKAFVHTTQVAERLFVEEEIGIAMKMDENETFELYTDVLRE